MTDQPETDAVIDALLPLIPSMGWTPRAIAAALREAGLPEEEATFLFPRGPVSAIEAWLQLADRQMAEAAGDLSELRIPDRIRTLIANPAAPGGAASRGGAPGAGGAVAAVERALGAAHRGAHGECHLVRGGGYVRGFLLVHAALQPERGVRRDAGLLAAGRIGGPGPTLDFLDRRLAGVARLGRLRKGCGRKHAA